MSYWLRLRLQWWWNCRQVHWHEIGLFWRDSCIQIHSSSVHFCINDSINCVWCCCGALQVYCTLRLYCLYNRYVTTLFIFFKGKNPQLTIQGNVVPSLFFKSLLLFKSYQRNAIFTKPKNINLKIDSSEKNKTFSNKPAKNLSSNHYYISHGKTKCCLDQKLIFLPMKKYYNCFKINVSFGYMCHWI